MPEPPKSAGEPADPTPVPKDLLINGIVAARNFQPYVQICDASIILFQLSIAEVRKVALDMLQEAARVEADAMILKFFARMEFPKEAGAALMLQFREFRHELDMEEVEGGYCQPPGEGPAT